MASSYRTFSEKACSVESVERDLLDMQANNTSPERGCFTTYMHRGSDELSKLRLNAYKLFAHNNAVLAGYEPGLKKMQEEVQQMAVDILNGGADGLANITSGGTESIFCAMHAAREWARFERPTRSTPEVVIPYSAHPAFDKSCHYLGMKVVRVPIGQDLRADVSAMAAAINENTIALAGSSPCWPYGLIDPIEDLAAIARKHNLWMHSDGCVGGFINPWLEELGMALPCWDFRVPGVRSMSADLHKHGYASKPCSIVAYRSEREQRYHWTPVYSWPAGKYSTSGFMGSRSGGSLATAWAVMKNLGKEGYVALARRSLEVKRRLVQGIEAIEDFKCLKNHSTMIFYGSETLDMFAVLSGFSERGYFPLGVLNPVLVQITAEPVEDDRLIDKYLADLAEIAAGVKNGSITAAAIARYV